MMLRAAMDTLVRGGETCTRSINTDKRHPIQSVTCIDIPHPVPQQTATADVNSAYHVNENEWGYRFRPHLRTCRINGAGKTF